ncbi:MAG: sugar phosphate isomerase/epimerase family protein [Halobacteriota archaeon]|nr:sugar phosphate isomerase/epimerase family protein [Halobacteriota archaeon]
MKLSISTWCFSNCSIRKNLDMIEEFGFENIEFNLSSIEREPDATIQTVKSLIDERGLTCSTVHSAGFYAKSSDQIEDALDCGKRSVDFAQTLSSTILVIHSYVSAKLNSQLRRAILVDVLGELKDYSSARGIELSLENLSRGSDGYGRSVTEVKNIFDIVDIGMTLDISHSHMISQTPAFLDLFKERINNIHVSNYNHRPIKKKVTPELRRIFQTLYEDGYDRPLTIEMHPKYQSKILDTKINIERFISSYV